MKYILYPMLLLSFVCNGADSLPTQTLQNRLSENAVAPVNSSTDEAGITLQADSSGHFRGTLLINNFSMPFLIDTGATLTVIPMKLAVAARLPFGKQVETNTAGGRSFAKLTQIDSMKIGSVEIKNIQANINQHLDEVLIGMNTLKFFRMNQTANTLTLVINDTLLKENGLKIGVSEGTVSQGVKEKDERQMDDAPSKPITKSVTCDEQKHCITRYDNQ